MTPEPAPAIGQKWRAADGGDYGYEIVGFDRHGDVICVDDKGKRWTIDPFKLSYRYKLVATGSTSA